MDTAVIQTADPTKTIATNNARNTSKTGIPSTSASSVSNSENTANASVNPSTTTSYSGPISVSLPPWQRLPSQNLSFGAAEILSVTECLQHAKLYHMHGRSIRCTGVIQEVLTHPPKKDGLVQNSPCLSVCLSDPLYHQHPSAKDNGASLWALFMTPEQTAVIRKTGVGCPVTVLGEPVESSFTPPGSWALRVRLCLPVAPTTNLALQWEALLLRRRHLQSTLRSTEVAAQGDVPRAGCGPPPYYNTSSTPQTILHS